MMDKQKRNSPPVAQPNGKALGFKIPKKKPDDWCEEKEATSPLARLPDNDFRTVTWRRRPYGSSYERYNGPINKNSRVSYASSDTFRFNRSKCDFSDSTRESEAETTYEARSSMALKAQESKVCRDVSNTSSSLHKDLSTATRKSRSFEQEIQSVSKAPEQKSALKNFDVLSPSTRDKTYCYKRVEHQNKKSSFSPSSANPSSSSPETSIEQSSDSTSNSSDTNLSCTEKVRENTRENKISSDEGCSSDPPRFHSQLETRSRTRRKKLLGKTDNTEALSLETIVLSSDEDEGSQKGCKPSYFQKTSPDSDNVSPPKDAEPMDHSGSFEDAAAEQIQSENAVLQLKFLNVYFGKKKGRATDMSKFTAESVEIPMKVPLCRITCLTVETRKLQKYGLWLTNGRDSIRSNAVIILWINPDYAQNIEKQMQLPSSNQVSKSNEFIFLELAEPLTSKMQSMLCEIMTKASKHGSTALAEAFSWDEMYSMLEHLPCDQCSFKSNCYSSAGSQSPEAKKVKSTYTIMQKWSEGCYSVAMVPEQSSILSEALRGGTPTRLLVYPPPPTKGGLAVSSEDLECLEHGEFLNDVIIDFYLKYLMLEKFTKPFARSCHIFSSFFFKCLTRGEGSSNDNGLDLPSAERRHQRVKTWTRHVDIFTKDFIFVPVNENSHWYLAVICFPWQEKAVYEDKKEPNSVMYPKTKYRSFSSSVIVFNDNLAKAEEAPGKDSNSGSEGSSNSGTSYSKRKPCHAGKVCKRPCILIFDSLKTGSVQSTVRVLREYLKVEWQVKQKTEREFDRSSMRDLYPKVPKQNNSTDCGLFLLQYVESFSQKPIDNFQPPMHLENWFPSCIVKNKREEIRDLILRLHLEQARKR